MGGSNSKKLRALVYLAMLLFLGWSTFSLMGDESQRPIQLGFGLGYITYALFAINKRIIFLTKIKIFNKLNQLKVGAVSLAFVA